MMVAEGLDLRYEGPWTQRLASSSIRGRVRASPIPNWMYSVFLGGLGRGRDRQDLRRPPLICTDVGVINSRLNVDGQMWGSLSQGIGLASPRTSTT